MLVIPVVYLCSDRHAQRIADVCRSGTYVLVTAFSGIAGERDHVCLGGYPGAVRDLLGVRTEEFFPLDDGETVVLDNGMRRGTWQPFPITTGGGPSSTKY